MEEQREKDIVDNLKLNSDALLIYKSISDWLMCMNNRISTVVPTINIIAISNLLNDDTKMTVVSDNTSIIQFIKKVPKISNKKILKLSSYCIGKKFCDYIHFSTGKIISDSIHELYKCDSEFLNGILSFYYEDEELTSDDMEEVDELSYDEITFKFNDVEITKISELSVDNLFLNVGYYIKDENLDYVHCFRSEISDFSPNKDSIDFDSINEFLEMEDSDIDSVLDTLSETIKEHDNFKTLLKKLSIVNGKIEAKVDFNPQVNNILVSTYMAYNFLPWVFNLHVK